MEGHSVLKHFSGAGEMILSLDKCKNWNLNPWSSLRCWMTNEGWWSFQPQKVDKGEPEKAGQGKLVISSNSEFDLETLPSYTKRKGNGGYILT